MNNETAIDILERATRLMDSGVAQYAATRGITAQYEAARGLRREYKAAVRFLKKSTTSPGGG